MITYAQHIPCGYQAAIKGDVNLNICPSCGERGPWNVSIGIGKPGWYTGPEAAPSWFARILAKWKGSA